ncbi:unnamed protein product [Blepharisma stoltei]|uniref:ATP synthase F0 subunit 8 n=1 Tax=Blepharisma stoltei TaxID=1481888 RepID=A0AAU9J2L6_9CILI|nr:unnamed protein product [Blepharisma stoltei]
MTTRYKLYGKLLDHYIEPSLNTNLPAISNTATSLIKYHQKTESDLINYDFNSFLNPYEEKKFLIPTSEEVYEQLSYSPVELPPEYPNMRSFRGLINDKKALIKDEDIKKHLPVTFTTLENWWEYEDFVKFPPYMDHYRMRMREWHRYVLQSKVEIQLYDPLWSVNPKDPNYDYYMFYFSTALKKYKQWEIQIPTHVLYERSRKFIYIMFLIMLAGFHAYDYTWKRTRYSRVLINMDWWLRDWKAFYKFTSVNSPLGYLGSHIDLRFFTRPIFTFIYGPGYVQMMDKQINRLRAASIDDLEKMVDEEAKNFPLL